MSTDPTSVQRAELDSLHAAGVLTDAEYADALTRVQDGTAATSADAVAQVTNVSVPDAQAAIDAHAAGAGDIAQDDVVIHDLEAERNADLDAAAAAGHNAEPSDVYDPAIAAKTVTCPHCGTPVPTTPTSEVTDAGQA